MGLEKYFLKSKIYDRIENIFLKNPRILMGLEKKLKNLRLVIGLTKILFKKSIIYGRL